MPWELLFRVIEVLLLRGRMRRYENAALDPPRIPLQPWHTESDRVARSGGPYPGT